MISFSIAAVNRLIDRLIRMVFNIIFLSPCPFLFEKQNLFWESKVGMVKEIKSNFFLRLVSGVVLFRGTQFRTLSTLFYLSLF